MDYWPHAPPIFGGLGNNAYHSHDFSSLPPNLNAFLPQPNMTGFGSGGNGNGTANHGDKVNDGSDQNRM